MYSFSEKFSLFWKQSVGPRVWTWRTARPQAGLSGQPHSQAKEPRAGSAWDPGALLSPIRAPQRDPSPALWSNPSPATSCSHIAHLPVITAVGCKNYIDLFALQKANVCQSTTWQVFMFFHWINLTFKHQATILISMKVNSSYRGPQLL